MANSRFYRRFCSFAKPRKLEIFGYKKIAGTIAAIRAAMAGDPFFCPRDGYKKKPAASYSRTGGSRTTLGDGALDFSVRNGNWYFCPSMATGIKP